MKEDMEMQGPNLDDYLNQGVYGQKETKPEERRKFLGTLRERVIIALSQSQVREEGIYKEVQDALKKNPNAQLLLNGHMNYSYLSKYTKLSDQYKVEYTMVTNNDHISEIGLVLAHNDAINKENIYVTKKEEASSEKESSDEKGIFSIFNNIFKS